MVVMGHTNFYAKMDLAKFGVLYKDRIPGSDPLMVRPKGTFLNWTWKTIAKDTQPIFNLIGGN